MTDANKLQTVPTEVWDSSLAHIVEDMNGKRNAELVVLRTAVHASNWYEWASHVVRGLDSELSLTEIERVLSWPCASRLSRARRATAAGSR